MLRAESEEEFTALRSSLTTKWPPVVVEHFDKTIAPVVLYHSGKWLIRQDKILFIQPQTHRCTRGHSKFTFYINTNRHIIYAIQQH
jgi:hypothetical protein